ncbi:Cation-transporting P-type ATPase family and Cation-transporting P-type ATPase, C-terminal domain and P-type ATPase, A domain and HAD-like domain and P-type ATPase, transmembrane domain and P-type ATPase, cytoplasmic domain N-containing protein [Strongyloides ratti]|uniref:Cation_ATPase_C domain-containing protein n=1 Tax=Strongyloides ratti TaxID=34506 RepID=A0A090LSF7_STRRB|nr:Cation-transporting P-type ATPase family and Cation-transporting P-type ATPase, C-terminal domain and P-type ATPase, A domain and HAD-like domain and P-type ATPase, transmembrane domain and P-type ATPase, cytoplasmic domain N-containing protein [Strongyloides ratti]CEF71142.1 Cation-transporting P-type ATPase family and Cation-transporting P-type ATPase, C-terminal domain and P-type ATPase, A domain and HAD-like domain and P-type ATPase, transmembrane domain and P-type ATPase, cytoplasmic domai
MSENSKDEGNLFKKIFKEYYLTEHTLDIKDLADIYPLSRINIDNVMLSRGLTSEEADFKLSLEGKNIILGNNYKVKNPFTWFKSFILEILHTFRLLMLFSAIICLLIFFLNTQRSMELSISIFLTTVLTFLCIASLIQKKRISEHVKSFQKLIYKECEVIRDNCIKTISAINVVCGDLLYVNEGDRLVADVRLLQSSNLLIESSWLTGQSQSFKYISDVEDKHTEVYASRNIIYKGSYCIQGSGLGLVVKTGNDTIIGKLIKEHTYKYKEKTTLEKEHKVFIITITIISFLYGLLTFFLGVCLNEINNFSDIVTLFINGFLVIVLSNIPHGLTVILTTQLIIVARRLGKQHMFIKKLEMAVTFGETTVLLCDKNTIMDTSEQKIGNIWYNNKIINSNDLIKKIKESKENNDDDDDDIENDIINESFELKTLIEIMCLCNRGVIEHHSNSRSSIKNFSNNMYISDNNKINMDTIKKSSNNLDQNLESKYFKGKPTDVSCLKFITKFITTKELLLLREINTIVYEEPFEVQSRTHLIIFLNEKDKNNLSFIDEIPYVSYTLMVKGAAEELFCRCSTIYINNKEMNITNEIKEDFEKAFLSLAEKQQSCLGFAYKKFLAPLELNFNNTKMLQIYCPFITSNDKEWSFIGMIGIETLIRKNFEKSINELYRSGISLFVTSGDHPETLKAVGKYMIKKINEKKIKLSSKECNDDIDKRSEKKVEVIHCGSLHLLNDYHWKKLLNYNGIVFFARTKPEDRLEIVKKCRYYNEKVTVTGHGILDSPALKEANTGIVVNAIGSILAQEAADVIAKDTTLQAITEGINEGKLLHKNFNKSIAYTLSHMLPQLLPTLMIFIFKFPLILNSIQLILIDLITELPPSISLIYQKEDKLENPKIKAKTKSNLIPWKLLSYCYIQIGSVMSIGCLLSYFLTYLHYGIYPSQISSLNISIIPNDKQIIQEASGAWHVTLVISQVFHIFSCATYRTSIFRKPKFNKVLILAVLFEILITTLILTIPFINNWLFIKPPPYFVYIIAIATGIIITLYNEVRKFLIRRSNKYLWVKVFTW